MASSPYLARAGWQTYTSGHEILCPAPAKDRREHERVQPERRGDPRHCNRVLGEVGFGLVVHVRHHPGGDHARPNPYTRTQDCKRCGKRIEFAEERVEQGKAAA